MNKDRRTVFVKGIPFTANDSDLETAFGAIGPIRKCFLIKPKNAEGHKVRLVNGWIKERAMPFRELLTLCLPQGCGMVQYAVPEDAERAVAQLHNSQLLGRQLQAPFSYTYF